MPYKRGKDVPDYMYTADRAEGAINELKANKEHAKEVDQIRPGEVSGRGRGRGTPWGVDKAEGEKIKKEWRAEAARDGKALADSWGPTMDKMSTVKPKRPDSMRYTEKGQHLGNNFRSHDEDKD